EVAVTLRVMEDITIPLGGSPRGPFGEPGAAAVVPPELFKIPAAIPAVQTVQPAVVNQPSLAEVAARIATRAPQPADVAMAVPVSTTAPTVDPERWQRFGNARPLPVTPTLIATKQGTVYAVTQYRRDRDILSFVLINGGLGAIDLANLDWATTTQLNAERGVRLQLPNDPSGNVERAGF